MYAVVSANLRTSMMDGGEKLSIITSIAKSSLTLRIRIGESFVVQLAPMSVVQRICFPGLCFTAFVVRGSS